MELLEVLQEAMVELMGTQCAMQLVQQDVVIHYTCHRSTSTWSATQRPIVSMHALQVFAHVLRLEILNSKC